MDIVELALACYRVPLAHQDQFALSAPLPEGMDQLLWLANGSAEVLDAAVARTGTKPQELRDAARFCIQQWCFVRGASPHRVLGVEPGAALEQIKEHHRLLIRLFHPDRAVGGEAWTDIYASRVNEAWTALSRMHSSLPATASSAPSPLARPVLTGARSPAEPSRREHPHLKPPPIKDPPHRQLTVPRHWLPGLVLGGLAVVVALGLGGFYLSTRSAGLNPQVTLNTASLDNFGEYAPAHPADRSALAALASAPDWQALERQEQQARQQAAQVRKEREQLAQNHREQLAVEEALVTRMRAERVRLEAQLKAEQTRMEQVKAERLAAEQRRLEQVKAEQSRIEQVKAERLAAEQRRLEQVKAELAQAEQARNERLAAEQYRSRQLQTEQIKAEQLADELRAERQRLERAKVAQARAEQAKAEQVKTERPQAEQRRLEEPLKTERARAEPVRLVVTAPDEQDLTTGEVENLMRRYSQAYQRGDLSGVIGLFATGARSGIQTDYATLFANHYIRGFWLRNLRWAYRGPSASGSGRYELQLRRRDNGELRRVEGSIRFTVQKRDNQLLIEAIEYDWPEKG